MPRSTTAHRALSLALGTLLTLSPLAVPVASADRIRDIATIQGIRDNAVIGYGLVVGLDGSGDQTTQTPFTTQTLTNMLSELGITVPAGTNMQLRNVAAVMVTASIPPFASPGQQLDVTVSSVGTAKNLRGGTLLMTPLKGADGQVYALAQGNVVIGGVGAEAAGSSITINQLSSGRIPAGATIERTVALDMSRNGIVSLDLKRADFNTAARTMAAINRYFRRTVATAMDARNIQLVAPMSPAERVGFLAQVQDIQVTEMAPPPKVTINARTGSIVMNAEVRLREAAVAHGNLSITIERQDEVSQPGPLSNGQTRRVPRAKIGVQSESGALQIVPTSANLVDVVNSLNALGASTQDLISILQALKAAGSLQADLEII